MKNLNALYVNLQLFAENTNTTPTVTSNAYATTDLTPAMKIFYSDTLIDNAKPKLVHAQFGQQKDIPQGNGKIIQFRKYSPLAKALTALTEGVTPSGQALKVSEILSTVSQYGGYITISDLLELAGMDNNILEATQLLGAQAGATLDTIIREILVGGTAVQYGADKVAARYLLVGGDGTAANNHYLNVDCIKRAVTTLKRNNAPTINGDYVAIIHPDGAYDLMSDSTWQDWQKYTTSDKLFSGEIGRIAGCRFVETTEAKIFHAEDLVAEGSTNEARTLTAASYSNKVITIDEALSAAEATALAGRKIIVAAASTYADPMLYTIASAASGAAGAATITVTETVTHNPADGDIIYPGEAGAQGRDVYATLVLGANAYGVTKLAGGGLETIVKQKGSSGVADALNQRSSVGWKATQTAERLVENFMVRVETASTFESGAN